VTHVRNLHMNNRGISDGRSIRDGDDGRAK
jgi:hypothetical protein